MTEPAGISEQEFTFSLHRGVQHVADNVSWAGGHHLIIPDVDIHFIQLFLQRFLACIAESWGVACEFRVNNRHEMLKVRTVKIRLSAELISGDKRSLLSDGGYIDEQNCD